MTIELKARAYDIIRAIEEHHAAINDLKNALAEVNRAILEEESKPSDP